MASPGQRRGTCGHVMAAFDLHKKCARCRDKKLGDDPCVRDKDCSVCDSLTDGQKSMLSTPQYQIRKDKKSGILVSPSKVTIVGPVESSEADNSAHAQVHASSGQSPGPSDMHSSGGFVSRQDFDVLNNLLEEKFAHFEVLLSRSNIFSTPKIPVQVQVDNPPVSDTPFINPSTDPRATGSVRTPGQKTEVELKKKTKENQKRKNPNRLLLPGLRNSLLLLLQTLLSRRMSPVRGLNLLIAYQPLTRILTSSPLLHLLVHLTNRLSLVPVLLVLPVCILIASLIRTPSCRTLMWILLQTHLTEIPVRKASCLIRK